jgi:CheY-like chemotaxis protein
MVGESPTTLLQVLVVDDCPDTTGSLAFLLNLWGHQAQVANSGPEALRLAAAHPPDVVLLDIAMPGMNGWEVLRQLKQLPGLKNTYLVVISGCASMEDRARSAAEGCYLHLTKPVVPELLRRLLLCCKARRSALAPSSLESAPSLASSTNE